MSLFAAGATHRGAPFAGRRRELGLLSHLIDEGLWGRHRLVRVEAEAGLGRRRLIAEALHRGPDAEWVQLAPGGLHADLRLWLRTELLDLLETYPEAPAPSWALHTLARWEPRLRRFAPAPALSAERLPSAWAPEAAGAAVGAILRSLTGRTLVIVDLGLWPGAGTPAERWAAALTRALDAPGAVVLAACDPRPAPEVDENGVRTLALDPLRALETEELAAAWRAGDPAFAAWLHRFTGGHPFFIQEVVRWLEELGHLRVDDDRGRVVPLDPLSRLPLPFNLSSVMESRYHRLTPDAARLLHLIVRNDGRLEMERLRAVFPAEGDGFEEALALLRRREFLLRRSFRRPVAAASPLWRPLVEEAVRRMPRLRYRPERRRRRRRAEPVPVPAPLTPPGPLGQAMRQLASLRRRIPAAPADSEVDAELARIARVTRGRTGPAWDGVRGRVAVLAALRRLDLERPVAARRWIRWGLARLSPDVHPALRRALGRLRLRALEQDQDAGERAAADRDGTAAGGILGALRREAAAAGHPLAAARLMAAEAEHLRRRGRPETAVYLADRAHDELAALGLQAPADLAAYTAVRARLDLRRLPEAAARLGRTTLPPEIRLELEEQLAALRSTPPLPLTPDIAQAEPPPPMGWGWGLDDDRLWYAARDRMWRAVDAFYEEREDEVPRWLESLDAQLERAGLLTDLADLVEFRLWVQLEEPAGDIDGPLAQLAELMPRLEAGERARRLAHLLRTTRAVGSAVYQNAFRPELRSAAPADREPEPEVRLHLLGLPRVVRPDAAWPMALWPEWWARLWTEAVGADLTGSDLSVADAERAVADAGDAPRADFAVLVSTANQLLREDRTVGGGLYLDGDRVRVSWAGIVCDARRVLDMAAEARERAGRGDPEGARAAARRTLSVVEGVYLPGTTGARTAATRRALEDAVSGAAKLVFADPAWKADLARDADPARETDQVRNADPTRNADLAARWLEGPGRMIDLRVYVAGLMERMGRRRAARALRNG